MIHAGLGVGDVLQFVVLHRAGKRHQRLDRIALFLDVIVEALLVAHGFEARAGHDHRLGAPADLVARCVLKVLDHDFGLLRDVVRVQLHEARQRPRGLLAFDVGVVRAGLEQLVVRGVARVMLQYVEDETLLDRLAHGVAMRRLSVAPKHRQRLVLGRGRKCEEAQVRLPAALCHAAEQLFHALAAFLGRTLSSRLAQAFAAEHFLEVGGRLAALRAVRLVDDDGAAPGGERARARRPAILGHLEQLARDERELLQRRDDDRHGVVERFRKLPRAFVDLLHHAAPVFELIDRVLQLLIEHDPVGHHDHAVENTLVPGVMQATRAGASASRWCCSCRCRPSVPPGSCGPRRQCAPPPPACAPPATGGSAERSSSPS